MNYCHSKVLSQIIYSIVCKEIYILGCLFFEGRGEHTITMIHYFFCFLSGGNELYGPMECVKSCNWK
jgi:hypothetical protein